MDKGTGPERESMEKGLEELATPIRPTFYPGFLASNSPDSDADVGRGGLPSDEVEAHSRSSSVDSPTQLSYLHDPPKPFLEVPQPSTSALDSSRINSTSSLSLASAHRPSPIDVDRSNLLHPPTSLGSGIVATGPGTPNSATSSGSSSKFKKRPVPLNLASAQALGMGQDEERSAQLALDNTPRSGITVYRGHSDDENDLSGDMNNLKMLKRDLKDNLRQRPLDGVAVDSGSEGSPSPQLPPPARAASAEVDLEEVMRLLQGDNGNITIVDTRPLGVFLQEHLPRSASLSIPSLIFKRYRRTGGKGVSLQSIANYVTTSAGHAVWENLIRRQQQSEATSPLGSEDQVVIIGLGTGDDTAQVLHAVLEQAVKGRVRILSGGWAAVKAAPEALNLLVFGEDSRATTVHTSTHATIPPPQSMLTAQKLPSSASDSKLPTFTTDPPPLLNASHTEQQKLTHQASMPSMRNEKRDVPGLSINPAENRRAPNLTLNLPSPGGTSSAGPSSASHLGRSPGQSIRFPGQRSSSLQSPGLSIQTHMNGPPKSPMRSSFQTMCHEQSKQPPSAASFGLSPSSASGSAFPRSPGHPPPQTSNRAAIAPFIVSTILPSFLYLGPEITSKDEIQQLKAQGIKRILNVAIECDDDNNLGLDKSFDKYVKVPMRDIIEEKGVKKYLRDTCAFLDDARLHSAPTYVHCKAGKSRSVTVVLAYLIHANAWTLKTAYAYVAERRKGISPNIGFVAELMQFEEAELGLKQSGGVHGDTSQEEQSTNTGSSATSLPAASGDARAGGAKGRYARESLPPTWATGSSSNPGPKLSQLSMNNTITSEPSNTEKDGPGKDWRPAGDDREVRKNGQWVQQRRAPVDRNTLQPGRRVSKAGLESLRVTSASPGTTLSDTGAMSDSPTAAMNPDPTPDSATGAKAATPGAEGRLAWV